MSEEQLKAFLEKVRSDSDLQEKLKAAASTEAAIEIAKSAGFSVTADDVQSSQSEPADDELESAAGGLNRDGLRRANGPIPAWGLWGVRTGR